MLVELEPYEFGQLPWGKPSPPPHIAVAIFAAKPGFCHSGLVGWELDGAVMLEQTCLSVFYECCFAKYQVGKGLILAVSGLPGRSGLLSAKRQMTIGRTVMSTDESQSQYFSPGAFVLVTLGNPREKFWGALLQLRPAGLTLRGIDLNSFDDFADMVRSGEPTNANTVFFPMHRVERVEIDSPSGSIPSLAGRFASKTGRDAADCLGIEEQDLFLPPSGARGEPR
jgi:hypothetical protein